MTEILAFEAARRVSDVGNASRIRMMGLYSEGPFTRVAFSFRKGEIDLRVGPTDTQGVMIHTIQSR